MNKILNVFIIVIISTGSIYGQNKTIKGGVISDLFEVEPAVLVMVNDKVEVGKTDLNGFFKITIPISVEKVSFFSLGLDPAVIKLSNNCNEIELVMMASYTYDFQTPKRVDKLRMKKFKKLSQLHKEAFKQGIFKTNMACYTQEFIPYHKN